QQAGDRGLASPLHARDDEERGRHHPQSKFIRTCPRWQSPLDSPPGIDRRMAAAQGTSRIGRLDRHHLYISLYRVMSVGTLYSQTAEVLRSRIAQNMWKQGDRLPSETQLCEEFGVSSITMRRAVATLVAEGLLVRLQGKGTFVSSDHTIVQGPPELTSFTQDMRARGWRASARVLSLRTERASGRIATKLGLSSGALVSVISRVRLADGQPVAIQTAHLPGLLFPGLETYDFS